MLAAAEAPAAAAEQPPPQASTSGRGGDDAGGPPGVHGARVEVRGMVKHFETRRGLFKAVNGVDVTIEPGTITALLGPSGSGARAAGCASHPGRGFRCRPQLQAAGAARAACLHGTLCIAWCTLRVSPPPLSLTPASAAAAALACPPAGKTTLLRLIAGLEEPTAGQVLFDGQDVTQAGVQDRDLGFVFQVSRHRCGARPSSHGCGCAGLQPGCVRGSGGSRGRQALQLTGRQVVPRRTATSAPGRTAASRRRCPCSQLSPLPGPAAPTHPLPASSNRATRCSAT